MTAEAAIILTGTIGAGKTSVAEAFSVLLHDAKIRHALIDLDWLGQLYPAPDAHDPFNTGLVATNLAQIWPNFWRAGARRVVLAGTVESREQLDALNRALPDVEITVCLVTAPPDLVKERIEGRDRGRLLDDFLARTDSVAETIRSARIHDFVVTNDGTPNAAAEEVSGHLGWIDEARR